MWEVRVVEPLDDAVDVLLEALTGSDDPIQVQLTIERTVAEKLLQLLEVEHTSGAVVVPIKELYTTTEAASMLGISRASLMKLIDSGDIEAVMVGTHHRVSAVQLLAFQRARNVSRERTSEVVTEFSARSTNFQSNVTFQSEGLRSRRDLVGRHQASDD